LTSVADAPQSLPDFTTTAPPSLQLYDDGWYCFACRIGGSIYDFGARLFELDTRGHQFLRLRQRLVHECCL
jgi:hypothetical protein